MKNGSARPEFKACHRRYWIAVLILSLVPIPACGRYRARRELRQNEYFAEILKRVDRRWIGDDRFFEENLLGNPSPEIRRWCAVALGRIASRRALPLLFRATRTGDAPVRAAAAFAIGEIEDREFLTKQCLFPDPRTSAELVSLLNDPSLSVQMRAIEALGKTGSATEAEQVIRRLERFYYGGSPFERSFLCYAITALARLNNASAVPVLERLAVLNDPEVQWHALDAVARLGDRKVIPLLIRSLRNPNPEVQAQAALGLADLGPVAADSLFPLLLQRDPRTEQPIPSRVRFSAIQAIGNLRSSAAIPYIKEALDEPIDEAHPDQLNFAVLASTALGEIGASEGEPILLPLMHSVQPVANSAVIALAKVSRRNPERFFQIMENQRFSMPAGLPAWIRALGELGGDRAAVELQRLLVRIIESPTRPEPELLPEILASLAKVNPRDLQEVLRPFLESREPAVARAAVAAYRPGKAGMDPWAPIMHAFLNVSQTVDSEIKIDILHRLSPWAGTPEIQQVLWTGLKDPGPGVRLASLALLRKAGTVGVIEDPGPLPPSVTDAVCRTLAVSRKNSTIAIVRTTQGTLEIELFREDAPLTAARFVLAAEKGDYDSLVFEDVSPSRQVTAGKKAARTGYGSTWKQEINMRPFERGSVGLALAGEDTLNGRFFIALRPQPFSDGIHTCFGRVISGIQVADRLVPGDRIIHVDIKETISFHDFVEY